MNSALRIGAVLLIVAVAGCVPSVHPAFMSKDIIKLDELIGKWNGDKTMGQEIPWHFKMDKTNGYVASFGQGKRQWKVTPFKIGKTTFLSLQPILPKNKDDSVYNFGIVPMYYTLKVQLEDKNMTVHVMDDMWLTKHLKKNPKDLATTDMGGMPLITAQSEALRELISKHEDSKLFRKHARLTKAEARQ